MDELISQYKSSEPKILSESKTIMSGLPADRIAIQSDASRTTTIVQFTLKDGKQYGISYNLGQSDDQPIIQQMIDSFQITRYKSFS